MQRVNTSQEVPTVMYFFLGWAWDRSIDQIFSVLLCIVKVGAKVSFTPLPDSVFPQSVANLAKISLFWDISLQDVLK